MRQAWDNPDNGETESSKNSKCDVVKDDVMLQTTHQ
jgi:hypothetical protein